MTEAWRSNPMHWCDVCKCWMNDNKAARMNHERGMKHKENLARKIRDMAKKADEDKRNKERAASAIFKIEDQAKKRFEADQAAAEKASGTWVWDPDAMYYYNEKFRWYYDVETKWYFGGEPTPDWAEHPPIPGNALFGVAKHVGGPLPQPDEKPAAAGAAGRPAATTRVSAASSFAAAAASATAGAKDVQVVKKVIELPKHPLQQVGGHKGPEVGRVGAAKGVGLQGALAPGAQAAAKTGAAGDKRKRAEKELTPEEAAFMAKREAARQRVAQRTSQGFGYL